MKFLFSLLSLLFVGLSAYAQQNEICGTDQIHHQLLLNDADYARQVQQNEQLIRNYLKSQSNPKSSAILQIPLVVHIVHTGEAIGVGSNISMSQIITAIDTLNARFRNLQGTSVDTQIEFVLAKQDPNGNATNGVVRVDGSSVPLYSTQGIKFGSVNLGANQRDVKSLSRWPNTQYYNIWVVNTINAGTNWAGFAYRPYSNPKDDGTVVRHTAFGTSGTATAPTNVGNVLTHELGHAFDLYHTFEGDNDGTQCPSITNGCGRGIGDCVVDTEPHIRGSGCSSGTNSCNGGSSLDDINANFMNYTSPACQHKFTNGQSARMRAAIHTGRTSLITSFGGIPPSARVPVAATCTPSTFNKANNFYQLGVYNFELNNVKVVSDGTVDEGDYNDHTRHQLITLDAGGSYPINVSTGPFNNEDVKVFIDYNGDGDFTDAGENVFTSDRTNHTPIDTAHSGTISIPSTGIPFDTVVRLRVISDMYYETISGPCYNPDRGQTEDYAVEIKSAGLPLGLYIYKTMPSCSGGNDGSAIAEASGGTAPYTYSWSVGSNTSAINNLAAGTYSVTVSDANGSTVVDSAIISQNPSCIAPQNLISRYIQDTSVRLNWDPVQGATLYKVLWRKASESNWNRYVRNIPIGRLDLDTLQPNTKYFWAVRAYKPSAGWSDFSSLENFTTLSGPCDIPDGLMTNAITDSRARLMWNVQANAIKYRIRYRPQGGNWDKKLVLGSRDRQFLTSLSPSTTYEWQIKSICTYGPSFGTTWSSLQSFTTDPSSSSQARVKGTIEEALNESLSVFPNPNKGEFTINFDREVESTQIRITDISGRLVYEGSFNKKNRIDLSPEISESGVYLLFIQEGDQQTVKRLVIQK